MALGVGIALFPLAGAQAAEDVPLPSQPLGLNDAGVVIGKDAVVYQGRSVQLPGPLNKGRNSTLVAVNNRGEVLLEQTANGPHYFRYDPRTNAMTPIGLTGVVQEGGAMRNVHLAYLTGLDDSGRVFGVYGNGHGPCGVVGVPTFGVPGDTQAPTEPATFTLLGCPGGGLRIRAMNSRGQMTGDMNRQGFLWSNGTLSAFRFPGSMMTQGMAINESGVIAGVFEVGNAVSENGEVAGKFTPGLSPPQKGFTYDGSQFRLLFMQRGTPIWVTGINNHGQIIGYVDTGEYVYKGFISNISTLPVAHMDATAGDLTAKIIEQHESASPSAGDEDGVDRAWQILRKADDPAIGATLRALQAVQAAGHLGDRRRVQIQGTDSNYVYISAETLRQQALNGLLGRLMSQLGAAQASQQGRQLLVDTVAALAGDAGLNQVRAAGELDPFGPVAHLNTPENRAQAAARAQFRQTMRAVIEQSVAAHPPQIPLRDAQTWLPPGTSSVEATRLDEALRMLQAQLGTSTAMTFLAMAEVRTGGLDGLFAWQVVEQLVGLNTRGERGQAEQVLCTLAGTPAPAKCPGLAALRASGGDREDTAMIVRNGPNPRAELADATGELGEQLLRTIYAAPDPGAQTAHPVSTASLRAPTPVLQGVINPIASPAGTVFSGSRATLKDGVLTFALKAPKDPRNGQMLTFRGLVPLPASSDKAWIAQDHDGYVVFSTLVPGVITGQVLPGRSGAPTYQSALGAAAGR
jgi:hypothetical protein